MEPPTVLPAHLGPGVRAGFTTRAGGASRAPYEGLDLALHVGDDPADVLANRDRLAGWAGAPVRFARQVHGTAVATVTATGGRRRGGRAPDADRDGPEPEADALLAAAPGVPVAVLVADCVPVLLADVSAGVVAAAHAGRRGLLAGVLDRVVEAMTGAGARPGGVRAVVGPAAGGCCYEVPAAMRQQAASVLPELHATTSWGTPSLDLRAGAVARLRALGVGAVTTAGGCTVEDPALYSYRRAPVTGRFAGVVVLEP